MTSPSPRAERRRATRAAATFPVRLSSESHADPAILRDLSEIGLACSAPQPIAEMTLVGLDFVLPGSAENHHVQGAVVRCAPLRVPSGAERRWDIAVYFTEVSDATRRALREYVAREPAV